MPGACHVMDLLTEHAQEVLAALAESSGANVVFNIETVAMVSEPDPECGHQVVETLVLIQVGARFPDVSGLLVNHQTVPLVYLIDPDLSDFEELLIRLWSGVEFNRLAGGHLADVDRRLTQIEDEYVPPDQPPLPGFEPDAEPD